MHNLIKPLSFFDTFSRKSGEQGTTHYCPGCGHGVVHKLLAEAMDELGIQDRTILITPVGCAVFAYYYLATSAISAPHGRAPAVGTAISRLEKDAITISYQGDGDLAAIGTSHTIHAANRGENMIVIFVNNNIYGMTGGQTAPTSLLGQKTATSPEGRRLENEGPPIKMAEMIATLSAPILVARSAVNTPKNVRETRKLIRRGLQAQADKKGYVFLEILSACPTNWHLSPVDSCEWIENVVTGVFPLGILKDTIDEATPMNRDVIPETASGNWIDRLFGSDEAVSQSAPEDYGNTTFPLRIKCAGFGGQGVLSLGLGFANLASSEGLGVTWLPSYGPEMRGGVANCSVVLGKEPIGSPIVDRPDVLIAMNKPSLIHFGPTVPEQGHIFYNRSLVEEIPRGITANLHPIDAAKIADQIGNPKVSNTVFLAAVASALRLFRREKLEDFVRNTFPPQSDNRRDNLAAVEAGWESSSR